MKIHTCCQADGDRRCLSSQDDADRSGLPWRRSSVAPEHGPGVEEVRGVSGSAACQTDSIKFT